jgi:hypothetical protein
MLAVISLCIFKKDFEKISLSGYRRRDPHHGTWKPWPTLASQRG